jgi:long-chain fatty acid transport protein
MINLNNTKGTSSFKTPAMAFLGVAWSLGAWTLACDAYWTEWSTFDKLSVTYNTPVAGASGFSIDKDWRDTWSLGFGVQYNLNQYIDLRAGYIYDQSPVPDRTLDPTVFFGDSQLYCIGLGVKFDRFTADLAYNYLQSKDRSFDNSVGDAPNPGGGRVTGDFKDADMHILVVNINYKF